MTRFSGRSARACPRGRRFRFPVPFGESGHRARQGTRDRPRRAPRHSPRSRTRRGRRGPVARTSAGAVPDVRADVVMVLPRRHERGAVSAARHVEPDRVAIELLGLVEVADAQMDMADAQAVGRAGEARIRGHFAQDVVDVERIGGDAQIATSPLPAFRRPVGVDLDSSSNLDRAHDRHVVRRAVPAARLAQDSEILHAFTQSLRHPDVIEPAPAVRTRPNRRRGSSTRCRSSPVPECARGRRRPRSRAP